MQGGWTYIMASKPRGMTYVGVTANPGRFSSFYCRKYGIRTLVLAEEHDAIVEAIAREKALKAWKRKWKVVLIEANNPDWSDLFDQIA